MESTAVAPRAAADSRRCNRQKRGFHGPVARVDAKAEAVRRPPAAGRGACSWIQGRSRPGLATLRRRPTRRPAPSTASHLGLCRGRRWPRSPASTTRKVGEGSADRSNPGPHLTTPPRWPPGAREWGGGGRRRTPQAEPRAGRGTPSPPPRRRRQPFHCERWRGPYDSTAPAPARIAASPGGRCVAHKEGEGGGGRCHVAPQGEAGRREPALLIIRGIRRRLR